MIDKWKTLRLLLEKFEREAKLGGDWHHKEGRKASAELNYHSERCYSFVLSKMKALDDMDEATVAKETKA